MSRPSLARLIAVLLLLPRLSDGLMLNLEDWLEDPDCRHETCRVSVLLERHINNTLDTVLSWQVAPAKSDATDRVAVTIAMPESPTDLALFNYIIRANIHRLGPEWALLIFFGSEEGRAALDAALGSPANIIWKPITLAGKREISITKHEANWFRLSMDFWGQIPQGLQHVLMFESDSLVLQGPGCVERFLQYSYVGSPWNTSTMWGRKRAFAQGGNGGFSLRRLDAAVAAVQSSLNMKNRDYRCNDKRKRCIPGRPKSRFPQNEDGEMVEILTALANGWQLPRSRATFPKREFASGFGVEQVFHPSPCGLHNPWEYLSEAQATELLATAHMS